MALMNGWMWTWFVLSLSQTVPIMIARPMYMATRIQYAVRSR